MSFDFVIITHLPSFYKVHLYNELARRANIFVVFLGTSSVIRASDFLSMDFKFEATFLTVGSFEGRNRWSTCRRLRKILNRVKYQKLIVGGWEHPEFWLSVFKSPAQKNCLALESGAESALTGPKAWLKKLFLSRIDTIFATGEPQTELAKHLQFTRTVLKTQGVGLFRQPRPKVKQKFEGRFLYVGRLAPEKNIPLLIQTFKDLPEYDLTIVGEGRLNWKPETNIHKKGHVSLEELPQVYQEHDVLILPSLSEPWGLVVEEALYQGLPVIVSNRVGAKEIVEELKVGVTFDPNQPGALREAIDYMSVPEHFQAFKQRLPVDFSARDEKQIETYLQVIA